MKRIHHLVIGDGRWATHLQEYLRLAQLDFSNWNRRSFDKNDLLKKCESADRILVAVSDDSIAGFIESLPKEVQKKCIHFSGCLVVPGVASAHPLMTFGSELYDLEFYRKIPFIVEEPYNLLSLLPEWTNPAHTIATEEKALYHSLCVMSGNFSMLLWKKLFDEFESKLGISHQAAFPYMQKVFENLAKDPKNCLTGPVVRNDQKTIASNLNSLQSDPFLAVYKGFVEAFDSENTEKRYMQ